MVLGVSNRRCKCLIDGDLHVGLHVVALIVEQEK